MPARRKDEIAAAKRLAARLQAADDAVLDDQAVDIAAQFQRHPACADMLVEHRLQHLEDRKAFLLPPIGARDAVGLMPVDDAGHIVFHLEPVIHQPVDQRPLQAHGEFEHGGIRRSLADPHGIVIMVLRGIDDAPLSLKLRSCSARSEEHTSELQSLMRISYAVFCLKKKILPNSTTPLTMYHSQ